MAANSSSSSNESLHPNFPSDIDCLVTEPTYSVFISFFITNILLLFPLCILILYLGLKRWQEQRFTSTATVTSHSDTFAYHMAAMELVGVFGSILGCYSITADHASMFSVGDFLLSVAGYGELFFYILTCVDPYLAVVHPITYLSLRRERGIRIRNITLGCVWLLCLGASSLNILNFFLIGDFCLLILSLIVIAFCSLSVLRVLVRPGPGERGGDRERVDQSKRKAFYTIMAIMGVLLFQCFVNLVLIILYVLELNTWCVTLISQAWNNVPGSLVLPLLFLNRAGTCCKNNAE